MSSVLRSSRPSGVRILSKFICRPVSRPILTAPTGPSRPRALRPTVNSSFHTSSRRTKGDERSSPTDLASLDVLGNTPIPSTSIDVCTYSGFQLNSGATTDDGSGVLLVGGEAFLWRPWLSKPSKEYRLLNDKGQWDINPQSLELLCLVWPRPDLLVLGLGKDNRPLSPAVRGKISEMGMRVEVLDTRNAAAQFNLLATERGVDDVAAAMIPIGWQEGIGAGHEDDVSTEE